MKGVMQGKLKPHLFFAGALCLTAGIASVACDGDAQVESRPEGKLSLEGRVALDFMAHKAMSGYASFEEHAASLKRSATAFCESPTASLLEDARGDYDQARAAWLEMQVFAFGPAVEQPQRLAPKINFQPPRTDDIEELLASQEELASPEMRGAHLRGFPVLEHLLFSKSAVEFEAGARECLLLERTSMDLAQNAESLHHAWSEEGGAYILELKEPSSERDLFETEHEALSGLVNRMGYAVENLRDREVRDPLGEEAGAEQVDLIVSRTSERSLQDMRDQLRGIESLFLGEGSEPGLSSYAASEGIDLALEFEDAFKHVRARIDDLEPSFEAAVQSDREAVTQLDDALLELQLLYQVELIGRLHLSQIFNDADGD